MLIRVSSYINYHELQFKVLMECLMIFTLTSAKPGSPVGFLCLHVKSRHSTGTNCRLLLQYRPLVISLDRLFFFFFLEHMTCNVLILMDHFFYTAVIFCVQLLSKAQLPPFYLFFFPSERPANPCYLGQCYTSRLIHLVSICIVSQENKNGRVSVAFEMH